MQLGPDPGGGAGLHVSGVAPGSMAEAAGLRSGDRLVRVGDQRVESAADARDAARAIGGRDEATLGFTRDGETHEARVAVVPFPPERLEGTEVIYGHVRAGGARLRTILTLPERTPAPGVLLLQGIARTTVDFAFAPEAPIARLVHGWARAGFATMRVDKRGVGDSEGDPEGADFAREVQGYRAALDALAAREEVSARFAFGHSIGGMALPLLDRPLDGAIVYGTSPLRWSECMRRSAARQLGLRGLSEAQIAERLEELERRPERHGVTEAYLAQLEREDLRAAWGRFEAPLLVVYGEHDWVVSLEEHRNIVELAPRAELLELEGLDHALTAHPSLEESYARYGRGAPDSRLLARTTGWMRAMLEREGER